MINFREKANFIWSVADLLRGDYKQADYGKVILPLTVLRRLDSLLEPTKDEVLRQYEKYKGQSDGIIDEVLNRSAKFRFHNHSQLLI
jgi:type I restriction enzyme M protein